MTSHTYAVTGASGHLGRAVLEALLRRGAQDVIATTRTPEALADYAGRGVALRKADFSDPSNLVDAFRGASRLLIVSTHGVGARSEAHGAAVEAAKRAGVRHIFYTSHPSPESSTSPVAPEHAVTERIILESGLKYTILRNFLYFENLLRLFPAALETGRFRSVSGDAKVAWLGRDDCADVAAAAMLNASERPAVQSSARLWSLRLTRRCSFRAACRPRPPKSTCAWSCRCGRAKWTTSTTSSRRSPAILRKP
jgi:NAD(P)H dehydrogenase (quinone)